MCYQSKIHLELHPGSGRFVFTCMSTRPARMATPVSEEEVDKYGGRRSLSRGNTRTLKLKLEMELRNKMMISATADPSGTFLDVYAGADTGLKWTLANQSQAACDEPKVKPSPRPDPPPTEVEQAHPLNSRSTPEFTKRLNAFVEAEVGATVIFECHYRGFPPPTFTWYRDDEQLVNGEDSVHFNHIDSKGILQVIVDGARKRDEGAYKCKIENQEGCAGTTGYLSVTGTDKEQTIAQQQKKAPKAPHEGRSVSLPPHLRTIVEQKSVEEREAEKTRTLPPSPLQQFIDEASARPGRAGTWPMGFPVGEQATLEDDALSSSSGNTVESLAGSSPDLDVDIDLGGDLEGDLEGDAVEDVTQQPPLAAADNTWPTSPLSPGSNKPFWAYPEHDKPTPPEGANPHPPDGAKPVNPESLGHNPHPPENLSSNPHPAGEGPHGNPGDHPNPGNPGLNPTEGESPAPPPPVSALSAASAVLVPVAQPQPSEGDTADPAGQTQRPPVAKLKLTRTVALAEDLDETLTPSPPQRHDSLPTGKSPLGVSEPELTMTANPELTEAPIGDNPGHKPHSNPNPVDSDNPGHNPEKEDNPGHNPQKEDNPGHGPHKEDNPGHNPQNVDNPGHHPQKGDNPGHNPQKGDNPGHNPQKVDNPGHNPQKIDNPGHHPQKVDNPGHNPQENPDHAPKPDNPGHNPEQHPVPMESEKGLSITGNPGHNPHDNPGHNPQEISNPGETKAAANPGLNPQGNPGHKLHDNPTPGDSVSDTGIPSNPGHHPDKDPNPGASDVGTPAADNPGTHPPPGSNPGEPEGETEKSNPMPEMTDAVLVDIDTTHAQQTATITAPESPDHVPDPTQDYKTIHEIPFSEEPIVHEVLEEQIFEQDIEEEDARPAEIDGSGLGLTADAILQLSSRFEEEQTPETDDRGTADDLAGEDEEARPPHIDGSGLGLTADAILQLSSRFEQEQAEDDDMAEDEDDARPPEIDGSGLGLTADAILQLSSRFEEENTGEPGYEEGVNVQSAYDVETLNIYAGQLAWEIVAEITSEVLQREQVIEVPSPEETPEDVVTPDTAVPQGEEGAELLFMTSAHGNLLDSAETEETEEDATGPVEEEVVRESMPPMEAGQELDDSEKADNIRNEELDSSLEGQQTDAPGSEVKPRADDREVTFENVVEPSTNQEALTIQEMEIPPDDKPETPVVRLRENRDRLRKRRANLSKVLSKSFETGTLPEIDWDMFFSLLDSSWLYFVVLSILAACAAVATEISPLYLILIVAALSFLGFCLISSLEEMPTTPEETGDKNTTTAENSGGGSTDYNTGTYSDQSAFGRSEGPYSSNIGSDAFFSSQSGMSDDTTYVQENFPTGGSSESTGGGGLMEPGLD